MTVRIGLYGLGMIGREHLRRIGTASTGGRVVAVADPNAAFAAKAVTTLAEVALEPDCESLVNRDDVDALVVTSGDTDHERAVLAAIAASKPVFCEKPLAPTAAGCLRVVAAEVAAGRRLVQVGFMRRFDAGYRYLKQALDDKAIGEPLLAHCAHRNPTVGSTTWDPKYVISQTAVHELDLARWLFDEEITAARVLPVRATRSAPPRVRDPLMTVLETRSGIHVGIETFVFCQYGYDIRCEIVGERGTISLPDPPRPQIRGPEGVCRSLVKDWAVRFADAYDTELTEWIRSVETGRPVGPSSWDGYAAQATCDAALRSFATMDGDRVVVEMADRPSLY